MLGGTLVNITGPCFNPTDKVTCRFGTEEVQGIVVDINKAICVQPRNVFAEGYIPFEIKIGAGKYNWKGKFFIETPATAAERIYFETSEVYEKSPKEIKITWEKYNLTRNENAPVQISLWGYRETRNTPELQYIDMLDESTINSGQYVISPENYKQRDNFQTMDMEFGFIQINLTESINYNGLEITPVIWSRPIPLGWYFGPQWENVYGAGWPMQLCDNWIRHDRDLNNFANKLPECPCSLKQAITDKGRYMPDYGCDKDSNPKCMYHRGAVHCVRSGPSRGGSEQECCYDINGNLMLAYGQLWGSRPSRCHNLGNLPWNEANKVPTLSQWFHDVTPFYSCCLWQEIQSAGCEIFRFDRRPSQDCIGYQPPSVATIFEDLRIKNFDSSEYTFSGKGEFVLAHVNTTDLRLDVQGKFEQLPQNMYDGDMKATQLTSVTAEGNSSAVIEVRIRPKNAQWRYRLDVFADGKRVYFDQPSLKFQHFPGVTVYTPTNILNQSEVIIMFESGAGVEVVETEGFIATRVYMPQKFINQTTGLFGKFNSDVIDDLTLPNGPHSSVITNDFGLKWLLTSNEEKKSDLSFEESWKMYDEVSEDYSLDDEE